jgi:hypothetical protein
VPAALVRSRRRDCVFIPNMDVALQFIEARRRAAEIATAEARAAHAVAGGGLHPAIAVGLLMLCVPPLAVTLVWSMPHFSRAAQIALTLYGALVTVVAGVLVFSLH